MSWASRRQFEYLSGLMLFVGLVVFLFIYPILFKEPTCTDGKQNGTEVGVDCGGTCLRMCLSEVREPVVLWSRAFPLSGNYHNLVALVENNNKESGIENISYEFKIYDTNNLVIGVVKGSTYIPPNKQFAVFESRFNAGESTVRSVDLEFLPPYNWVKKMPTLDTVPVTVDNIIFNTSENNFPVLSARVNNNSIYDIPGFDIISILYDVNRNAINASKTSKSGLQSNEKTSIVFTWPKKFESDPVTEDVLVQINPFSVSF